LIGLRKPLVNSDLKPLYDHPAGPRKDKLDLSLFRLPLHVFNRWLGVALE
jgi:hypothetical protein